MTGESSTVHINCNPTSSFILLIIVQISASVCSFCVVLFYIVSSNHMHFYEVLCISVKEETSLCKVCRQSASFLAWVRVHRSDDGPKNGSKLVTFVMNCVLHD